MTTGDRFRRRVEARFVPFIEATVSKDLFKEVHQHSLRFFEEEMSGKIAGKIRTVVDSVERMFYQVMFGICTPMIEISMALIFIALADYRLALILGALDLVFGVLVIFLRKNMASYFETRAKTRSEASGIFVDGVTNAHLVKSFANYLHEKSFYFRALHTAARAHRAEMLNHAGATSNSQFAFDLMTVLSYAVIFYFWYRYDLTVANVVLATSLIGTCVGSLRSVGYVASDFMEVYGSIADGLALLNRPCEVLDCPNAVRLRAKNNCVIFDRIVYHYQNDKPLFDNFTLRIEPDSKIGLVGHSGSGKSTLIKLLMRYYDLQGGRITVGGTDIASVTQDSLRQMIAVIPQESTLFNRSIMENIRYGNPKADDEAVIRAAKKAYIHDFIMSLPEQYNSKVGERGVMLSGGERQRISIARAILRNAPILILDEATSALDSESERYIQKSLKALMKNKTVIVIAHRLSTLQDMDRLVVLDNGKIIEDGSHKTLMKKRGAYYRFYDMQSAGFLPDRLPTDSHKKSNQ
jgi:ATP-binding cassette subfamily B protein